MKSSAKNLHDKVDMGPIEAVMSLPPAPIMLIGAGEKEHNVTTIGMFNLFSMQPVLLGIGVKSSRTLFKLLDAPPDFSVNVPSKDMVDQVIQCGEKSGSRINKFEDVGLTPVPGKRIKSPSVGECIMNIECKRKEVIEIGDHHWFLGEVVHTDLLEDYDRGNALQYWDGEYRTVGKIIKKV